jgi:centractin
MENLTIVIDNGSGFIKSGFSGEDNPRCYFPAIVGVPNTQNIMIGCTNNDFYFGS